MTGDAAVGASLQYSFNPVIEPGSESEVFRIQRPAPGLLSPDLYPLKLGLPTG